MTTCVHEVGESFARPCARKAGAKDGCQCQAGMVYAAHGVCSEQTKWEWRTTRGGCVFTLGMHSVHHTSAEQSNHKSFGSKGKPAAALSLLPLPVMDRASRLHRRRALVNEVILHLVSKPPVVVTARPLSDVDYGRVLEYALLCTRRRSSNQQCGGAEPTRRAALPHPPACSTS